MNTQGSGEFRELNRLVTWLRVAFAMLIVVELVNAWSDWLEISLFHQIQGGIEISDEIAQANDERQRLLGILYLVVYVATAILFLRWTYLVKKNSMALSHWPVNYTPAWSVGWYFVPVFTLWEPYKALKESFQASNPQQEQDIEWISVPALLPVWWTLWILNNLAGRLIAAYHPTELSGYLHLAWARLLSTALDLPLVVVVWLLISEMLRWQSARHAALYAPA